MKKPFHSFVLLVSSILLFTQFLPVKEKEETNVHHINDQINLALRQVGHKLLSIEGKETTQIPPVESDEKGWHRLRLESSFNYDTLPFLLDQALEMHDMEKKYQVTIRDCDKNQIVLGYNHRAFLVKEIACIGRDQSSSCNIIEVMLLADQKGRGFPFRYLLGLLGLVGLGWYLKSVFFTPAKSSSPHQSSEPVSENMAIGMLSYDYKNQMIKSPDSEKALTFRENKLLLLLASNPNQVMEREKILEEVWGDEGVIVGRSLDVFISRLRKILKMDPNIKIKSIHGVGYKLVC